MLDEIIELIKIHLNQNLYSVILGGSRGRNMAIEGWSDYDIYIILKDDDIKGVKKLYTEIIKKYNFHIGLTFYTLNEIKNKNVDDKTKIIFYERENMRFHPTIYGNDVDLKFTFTEIKEEGLSMISNVIHEIKRNLITENYKKLIKKITLLIKILLRNKNEYPIGYINTFEMFYKLCEKNNISIINKINIENCIKNNNYEIENFVIEILEKYLLLL